MISQQQQATPRQQRDISNGRNNIVNVSGSQIAESDRSQQKPGVAVLVNNTSVNRGGIFNRRINKIIKKDINPMLQQMGGGFTYRQQQNPGNENANNGSGGQYFSQMRGIVNQNNGSMGQILTEPVMNIQHTQQPTVAFPTTLNSPRIPVHGKFIFENLIGMTYNDQVVDKHYSVVLAQSNQPNNNLRQKTSRNLPQIPSLKLSNQRPQPQQQQNQDNNGSARIRLTSINNSQDLNSTQLLASNSKGFNPINQILSSTQQNPMANILGSSSVVNGSLNGNMLNVPTFSQVQSTGNSNMPSVTNIHNIKNYNNYHFEIKNPQGAMPFIPEDSRSLDRIINNANNQSNKPLEQSNIVIQKRPAYNSQNPPASNQSQSNFNKEFKRKHVPTHQMHSHTNVSIDTKRSNGGVTNVTGPTQMPINSINLSNQKLINNSTTSQNPYSVADTSLNKTKFMLTMGVGGRQKNNQTQQPAESMRYQDPAQHHADQRRRMELGGSPGVSSLAADAANQSIEENQKRGFKVQFPMNPRDAVVHLSKFLLDYEKSEVLEYDQVYFLNILERKAKGLQTPDGVDNNGFDNDKNEYICDEHDHIAYRFEIVKRIGKGSFGQVFKSFDHLKKEFCALKILRNKKRLYKQGLIEVGILETLKKSDPEDKKNIIRIKESFVFRKHLVLSFEMLSMNLYEFIKMNNFQGVSVGLVRRFAIQLLVALHYMKEHNIVHCDMKPENILLRKPNKSGIKVIDFGSGTYESEQFYTYIQSRFYRAPEIMMGIRYTPAIDMWSLGCILYELYVGYPIFAGEDEKEQMQCIMEVKGVPPRSLIVLASRRKIFFDDDYTPVQTPNSKGKIRKPNTKSLEKLLNCEDDTFVDFLDKCLEWKPDKRMTPDAAFQHPWIKAGIKELKQKIEQQQQQSLRQKQQTQMTSQTSDLPNIASSKGFGNNSNRDNSVVNENNGTPRSNKKSSIGGSGSIGGVPGQKLPNIQQ